VAIANFPGDMTVPQIGGQAITAVVLLGGFDGNVIRAFELDDVWCEPGDPGVAPALGVGGEAETEFLARIAQRFEIPDYCSDSSVVGHEVGYQLLVIG
jgi:hypothetical protein